MDKPCTPEIETARRIAIRAQALDGSATGVLDAVRRLGFLQLDPIATVAPPQHLVLLARLGPLYDPAELDRLLWEERKLVEWNAFVYPIETLPLLRARMREPRRTPGWEKRVREFLHEHRALRRHILRELDRNGPLLSRDLDHEGARREGKHRWYGNRVVGLMLEVMAQHGEVAVAGRSGGQRLWDLAERWYPETEAVPVDEAERLLDEQRFRSLGVRLVRGKLVVHPEAEDGPVPDRAVLISPFDRLIHDRARAEALWGFRYRLEMYVPPAKREYGYYVLPLLAGDELVGRAEPRYDRKTGELELLGAWGETSRVEEALQPIREWLAAR